jgi:hypothetical protein
MVERIKKLIAEAEAMSEAFPLPSRERVACHAAAEAGPGRSEKNDQGCEIVVDMLRDIP